MKIKAIRTYVVSLPMRRAHVSAVGAKVRRYVLVEITTDSEFVGYGEAPVLKEWGGNHGAYYGESYGTVLHVVHDILAPVLKDQDPLNVQLLHAAMDSAVKGHPYAKAAIDMALYDIQGKFLGVPVYQLLGGCVRSRVPVCHSIGIMPADIAASEAGYAVEDGIKAIKLKIGLDLKRDLEAVRRVREAIGDDITITVDANQAYATASAAVMALKQMEVYGILFAEQPVQGVEAMAQVAHRVSMPLMHDEGAWTPRDILRIYEHRAGELISLYTTKPGGLWPAKKVAAVAEAAGFLCNVNGSAETGVGNAANLHLAASTPVVVYPCVIPVTRLDGNSPTNVAGAFFDDDIITEPFEFVDGSLVVPSRPGLGVTIDKSKLQKYVVGQSD